MNKPCLTCVAAVLLCASVALGQGPETPPAPTATLAPPTPLKAPEPPAGLDTWEGIKACFSGDAGPTKPGVFTAEAQYVIWFLAGPHDFFPLSTTNIIGQPGNALLAAFGDAEQQNREPVSGTRFSFGYWQVQDNPWVYGGIRDLGVEATFFFVGQRSASFVDASSPTIVRPFFDQNDRVESGFIVATPGLATGGLVARAQADLWGAELNLWKNACYNSPGTIASVNMLAGFRYLDFDERLGIGTISVFNQDLTAFPVFASFAGNTLQVSDSFAAHNRFYGGQIGIEGKFWPGDFLTLDLALKLGIGATSEDLHIEGAQLRTLANGTQTFSPAGLLALPSNSGDHHMNKFAQVPELDLKISYPVMSHVTLSSGFSMLYWSRLLRPAQQIDRNLDVTQIPNFPLGAGSSPVAALGEPRVPFMQSDLLLLGVSFGLEINW